MTGYPGNANGVSTSASFNQISGIAFDESSGSIGAIIVLDSGNLNVRILSCNNDYAFYAGECNVGPTLSPTTAPTYDSEYAQYADGNLKITTKEVYLTDYSMADPVPFNFTTLSGLTSNPSNRSIYYVADEGTDQLYVLDISSNTFYVSAQFQSRNLTNPRFLAADPDSNVYVIDDYGIYIFYYDPSSYPSYQESNTIQLGVNYTGLAVDSNSTSWKVTFYTIDKGTDSIIEGKLDGVNSPWILSDFLTGLYKPYSVVLGRSGFHLFAACGDYKIYQIVVGGKYVLASFGSGYDYHNDASLTGANIASFDSQRMILEIDFDTNLYVVSDTSYSVRIVQVYGNSVETIIGDYSKFTASLILFA